MPALELHETKVDFLILNLYTVVSKEILIKNLNPEGAGINLNSNHTLDLVFVIDVSVSMRKYYLRIGLEFAKGLLRAIAQSKRYSTSNN